ncbi:MAG TPA: right-handed parallel beta-helix repeat-containing protein [Candidatus Kapabacteria bacterium]|nr:right-handed parallel beta-helix repeat-containing protein [Candidatus Kapabacteria bacterium]
MRRSILLLLLLLAASGSARATTWLVGASRTYTAPSKVSSLVKDGDTVAIDAGTYTEDVAHWTANNLLLMGVGGYAHLNANGTAFGGKAIWVIGGTNTTVMNIEFSHCSVPDNNGAGIRQEGVNLTVRHCSFHDNQEGILAGDNPTSDIVIEYTEFNHNGAGDGYSHNLYINHVRTLLFRFNWSHRAVVGHELKSRAYNNVILFNRLANEATGTASREIDLPNGGTAIIAGNEIEQGPAGENSNIIGFGLEGLTNPTAQELYLINNTIVNDRGTGSFVNVQNGTALVKAYNNIFAGPGTIVLGTAASIDTSHNIYTTVAAAGFVNPAAMDYHLTATAAAVNGGGDVGSVANYPLILDYEYVQPAGSGPRTDAGSVDVGAHGYQDPAGIDILREETASLEIHPNPISSSAVLSVRGAAPGSYVVIYNVLGAEAMRIPVSGDAVGTLTRGELPGGTYVAALIQPGVAAGRIRTIVVR